MLCVWWCAVLCCAVVCCSVMDLLLVLLLALTHLFVSHILVGAVARRGFLAGPQRNDSGKTLSFWCFSPGVAFSDLPAMGVRSIIVTRFGLLRCACFRCACILGLVSLPHCS